MNLEAYAQSWIQILERRKNRMSYAVVWCLLGLGAALLLFGFIDKVWGYYLEGLVVVAAAIVLFIVEACWRRITELKMFLSEYVEAERKVGVKVESLVKDADVDDSERL